MGASLMQRRRVGDEGLRVVNFFCSEQGALLGVLSVGVD